jgi:hypothetical protein
MPAFWRVQGRPHTRAPVHWNWIPVSSKLVGHQSNCDRIRCIPRGLDDFLRVAGNKFRVI